MRGARGTRKRRRSRSLALVQAMLKKMPEARPMARQLSSAPYFDNLILKALIYMDALSQKAPAEKAQFFRSLPKALPQFPERIVMQKVWPRFACAAPFLVARSL